MEKKRMLFIYNPHSGKGQMASKLSEVLEIFSNAGYMVTVFPTNGPKHATELVVSYMKEFDYIVCSGGDGTLHEVTEGIISYPREERKPCGYIPAGTVNDFATSLSIPKDIIEAAQTVIREDFYAYDIGSTNGQCFTYFSGFGAFTDVSYETNQTMKNLMGKMAYIMEGAKRFKDITSYHMKIMYDDVTIEDEFIFGMVGNTYSVGGFLKLSQEMVALNDGLYDGVFIRMPKNVLELQKTLVAMKEQDVNCQYLYCFHASKITIISEEEVKWTLDGEYGGSGHKFVIENHKQAVSYAKGKEFLEEVQ